MFDLQSTGASSPIGLRQTESSGSAFRVNKNQSYRGRLTTRNSRILLIRQPGTVVRQKTDNPNQRSTKYNSYNNVKTDYSGKTLTIYANNNNGKAYLDFSVKEDSETTNVVTNGSSRSRETSRYIKGLNNAVFREIMSGIGDPYFYYEIISSSRYDDRQSLFCVGCFIDSGKYYFVIKKQTFQNGNIDSPIFDTNIVSTIDYSIASQIAEVLNRYIPQIAMPVKYRRD